MDDYAGEGFYEGAAPAAGVDPQEPSTNTQPREPDEAERRLVARIRSRILSDKNHHKKAYNRMRRDMQVARLGATEAWAERNYTANIIGRHIKQLVASLYAKNPKAVARRRARLDFEIWDETEASLQLATQMIQQFSAMAVPVADPMTGMMAQPMMPPEVQQAQALMMDFQQGMMERQNVEKVGKTLEVLFEYFTKEQKPVDFKTAMKQLVRRASTTCVGYAEVGFQREYGANGDVTAKLADVREQLNRIKVLSEKTQEGQDTYANEADVRELELSIASLQQQEYVLLREGLIFDFPESTRVIPDKRCRKLTGFVGARWVTVEYLYSSDEVKGLFDVDLGRGYTPYTSDGRSTSESDQSTMRFDEEGCSDADGLACVWKQYDRTSGLVYYVCDGHKGFLKQPGPPDVYVEDFWPVYALTFNEGEADELFPLSDVALALAMQEEYNDSRQGKREHRKAARPRFMTPKGALDDESKALFSQAEPFSVTEVNPQDGNPDLSKILQAVQVPGVDPNLYDTNEVFTDMGLVVGAGGAAAGNPSAKVTATGEALAEDSREATGSSAVDDLDSFLTVIARAAGQVMLREMSEETVKKIAGRGAVWPQLTLEELAGEVYLEVEAGSSGKPNAAQEIRNWREMLPFLIQIGKINPMWLAKESLRRLDDRMDLTDAIGEEFLSIVAMNQNSQPSPMDPGADPNAQGPEGGQNSAPAPQAAVAGGEPGMGNNRL